LKLGGENSGAVGGKGILKISKYWDLKSILSRKLIIFYNIFILQEKYLD
jgi:hypothetical protein